MRTEGSSTKYRPSFTQATGHEDYRIVKKEAINVCGMQGKHVLLAFAVEEIFFELSVWYFSWGIFPVSRGLLRECYSFDRL